MARNPLLETAFNDPRTIPTVVWHDEDFRIGPTLTPTTELQDTLDAMSAGIAALRFSDISTERHFDALDPSHLRELTILTKRLTAICDVAIHEIAVLGGVASRDPISAYRQAVSEAVDGNLIWEMNDKADRLENKHAL